MRNRQLMIRLRLALIVFAVMVCSEGVVSAQFNEDYGDVGSVQTFKGQVTFSDDTPMAYANLELTSVSEAKEYSVEANESGYFAARNLPAGKYRVRVRGSGSNSGTFLVRITNRAPVNHILVKLAPGCASGDSGITLVKKAINPRRYR